MRALLDVNVLIALLDADHVHHDAARMWLKDHIALGWASSTMADLRTPRLVVAVALAAILVGVAGAQDAPKVDDLLAAVERGDADAQWQLGDAYHHGRA